MERLHCHTTCKKVTDKYPDYFTFNAEAWFANTNNHAYIESENVGFAELKTKGNYWVHFCFNSARGRSAIDLTKRMVEVLFEDTHFSSLVGLIHVDNKPAKWVIRQVGFVSCGVTDTPNGQCEMFIFTRAQMPSFEGKL